MPAGRPTKEFDKKAFSDLIGFGCSQEEICWFFRDADTGKPANPDTLSRWCKRVYDMNFQEYKDKMGLMPLKIQLRKNQLDLSKKSAAMAIWLGKQYLGQRDEVVVDAGIRTKDDALSASLREMAKELESDDV